jgi:hypothetical protein
MNTIVLESDGRGSFTFARRNVWARHGRDRGSTGQALNRRQRASGKEPDFGGGKRTRRSLRRPIAWRDGGL